MMLASLKKGDLPGSEAAMENIAEHYGIPSINMGLEVARLEQAGKLVFTAPKPETDAEKAILGAKIVFSPDGVHPYIDSGHRLYLDAVARGMTLMKPLGDAAPHRLIQPITPDNWENAKLIPLEMGDLSGEWKLDSAANSLASRFSERLPSLWEANHPGDSIQFKFRGTAAAVYDIIGPNSGQVIITLDDQKPVTRPLFDAFCLYYRLSVLTVATDMPDAVHSVKIEISPDQLDKAKILHQRNENMDDPKRFEGQVWYAGGLMLVGDLVK
jgi:hypothetical protein